MTFSCHITALYIQSTLKKARCEMMILAPTMQQRQEKEAELFCLAFQRVSMLPNKGRFSYQILSCREQLCKNSTSLLPSIFELFFLSLSKLRQCVLCRGGPGWSANGKNKFNRWITFNRVLSQRLMLTLGQQLQKYPNNHSISIELIIIFFCSLSTACKASQNHVVLLLRTSKNLKSRNVSANVENLTK